MNDTVKVLVLRTAGTNCDQETAFAFESCGAVSELVHIKKLLEKKISLNDYHILAIPGGFTYGDDIESGRILANEIRIHLGADLQKFIEDGKLVIGICNGFQTLVKAGFLPGPIGVDEIDSQKEVQKVTLTNNDNVKFEARWSYLEVDGKSPWTQDLKEIVYFPVAHAEGKFVPKNDLVLDALKNNGQVAFRYCNVNGEAPNYPENPNGSVDDIAGITDATGRILGLMPHPERHFHFFNHPNWTRRKKNGQFGDGQKIFQNGVDYVKKNFC
jgi:phosphoribosylformylglycinamidine synthase I